MSKVIMGPDIGYKVAFNCARTGKFLSRDMKTYVQTQEEGTFFFSELEEIEKLVASSDETAIDFFVVHEKRGLLMILYENGHLYMTDDYY